MSGYCGYSMSNNAVDCYNDGYMPLSKMFNETAFYGIDEEWLEIVTNKEIDKIIGARTPKREEKQIEAYCQYLTWSGTRRYPKAEVHEDWGYIKGDWFYINGGSRRKCIYSRGFKILKTKSNGIEHDYSYENYLYF